MDNASYIDWQHAPKKQKRIEIVNDEMCSTADRYNFSDSQMCSFLSRTQLASENKNNVTLSVSSVQRRRKKFCKSETKKIKESFDPLGLMTIHWDGKLFQKGGAGKKINRLVVVVTGNGQEKVLEAPATESGKGVDEVEAVFEILKDWNLCQKVRAINFDTTSSNTGCNSGACTLLEEKLGRKLYRLACRHHVMELIPSGIYNKLVENGITKGLEITLFEKFRKS